MKAEDATIENLIRGIVREELARAGIPARIENQVYIVGEISPEAVSSIVGLTRQSFRDGQRRRT